MLWTTQDETGGGRPHWWRWCVWLAITASHVSPWLGYAAARPLGLPPREPPIQSEDRSPLRLFATLTRDLEGTGMSDCSLCSRFAERAASRVALIHAAWAGRG